MPIGGVLGRNSQREPSSSEIEFFRKHPSIGGMLSEDKMIVLNPGGTLSDDEKQAVALNEAVRKLLRDRNIKPTFAITQKQREFFRGLADAGIPGETSDEDIRATIIGRIVSGDPSAQDATTEQKLFADRIREMMSGPRR